MFNLLAFKKTAAARIATIAPRVPLTEEVLEECYTRAVVDQLRSAAQRAKTLRGALESVRRMLAAPDAAHKDGAWVMVDRASLEKVKSDLAAAEAKLREFEASF